MAHISVLMDEVLEGLDLCDKDIVVDGTINGGGHSLEIIKKLSSGVLVGIDQDSSALSISKKRFQDIPGQVYLINDNFRNIDHILEKLGFHYFDKLLLDLGWSSNQFENPERGFSFIHDGPLLMTLSDNPNDTSFTAYDVINYWEISSLIDIFEAYGQERYSKRIANAIGTARSIKPIETTLELAEIIRNAVPIRYRNGFIHPATKIFQAIRIAVNDEMGALREVLEKSFQKLSSGGRMVIISFHSLEDRIVKHFYKKKKEEGFAEILTKKPIIAGERELCSNKRARSAKLRILIKK